MYQNILKYLSLSVLLFSPISQAESGSKLRFSSSVDIPFDIEKGKATSSNSNNVSEPEKVFKSCLDFLNNGETNSGNFTLSNGKQVYCDMVNNGGGWMLYLDFGNSTERQALVANGINTAEKMAQHTSSQYISTFNNENIQSTSDFRITEYADQWVNFYYYSSTIGKALFSAPAGYESMRVDFGNGYWLSKSMSSFVVVNLNGVTQSRINQATRKGQIDAKSSVFKITEGDTISISEANSVNYLDAIWVK